MAEFYNIKLFGNAFLTAFEQHLEMMSCLVTQCSFYKYIYQSFSSLLGMPSTTTENAQKVYLSRFGSCTAFATRHLELKEYI